MLADAAQAYLNLPAMIGWKRGCPGVLKRHAETVAKARGRPCRNTSSQSWRLGRRGRRKRKWAGPSWPWTPRTIGFSSGMKCSILALEGWSLGVQRDDVSY